MKIFLKAPGLLGDLIPTGEFLFPGESLSLQQFFRFLTRTRDDLAGHLLPAGNRSSRYAVLINGVHIDNLEGMQTVLKDGDRVSIFPPVAGG
jgi:molybdopterin synthase sulfur carrier subunit